MKKTSDRLVQPASATPRVMKAAVKALERRRRAARIGWTALGGGSVAAVTALGASLAGFLLGRYVRRR